MSSQRAFQIWPTHPNSAQGFKCGTFIYFSAKCFSLRHLWDVFLICFEGKCADWYFDCTGEHISMFGISEHMFLFWLIANFLCILVHNNNSTIPYMTNSTFWRLTNIYTLEQYDIIKLIESGIIDL
mmetsp:Transcript_5341/g.7811  ORF Transcript_5341/g.7811 Transcript_5341/m.7811 type:complete len:126 (-) Transcript_5341:5-382(-)